LSLRSWSERLDAHVSREPVVAYDMPGFGRLIPNWFELGTEDRLTEPEFVRWAREPFERKVYDFQRKCLNPCPLGGWGTCVLDSRMVQNECQSIAGRTLVSSAAQRTPMVRDVLKLLGSQTTKLPTEVDRGLRLSPTLVQGGGTLGIEARW
jgi:hypothetical protein